MKPIRTLSPALARRFAITRQRLAGPRPATNAAGILEVVRDLGCLQLDPTSAVARSHLLVLWSRLGAYDVSQLDSLLWQERKLFEYWAHCASIVLTEDYPIFNFRMRNYTRDDSPWLQRVRNWIKDNEALRRHILTQLRRHGPLPARALQADGIDPVDPLHRVSSGWTAGRNVSRMLDFLWAQGKLMVAGRSGGQKLWDLAERCLPEWTPRDRLSEREVVRRAAQKSLRALGVGTAQHIQHHFTRGHYPGMKAVLAELEAEQSVERVQISGAGETWPGDWYIHTNDLPLLDRLAAGDWQPRTTLLSPFDNLICDRTRTEQLFNFRFRVEIYVPAAKRQHGYFVLPILHGDQLIGRINPTMDRAHKRLHINAVYAEPAAPTTRKAARAVAEAVADLGDFLGANEISYSQRVPAEWQKILH